MKKIWFVSAVLAIVSVIFVAQTPAPTQDPKAQGILDAMSNKYKAMTSFKAGFSLNIQNAGTKLNENSSGVIKVKGNKFHLDLKKQEIYNNGTTVWTYVKSANEVTITDYEPAENEITPDKIHTIYKKGYKYRFVEEKNIGGVITEVVELNPIDFRNSKFHKIVIEISKADKSLKTWKIYEKNNNVQTYSITSFQPNIPVTDADFNFDPKKYPAGLKTEELRDR